MNNRTIWLHRQPDGSFVDWGRNGPGRHRGQGGAVWYRGEAAKVMALVVRHSNREQGTTTMQSRADMCRDQPEPCLKGRCRSVTACSGFGYCRERNTVDTITTPELIEQRRAECRDREAVAHIVASPESTPKISAPELTPEEKRARINKIRVEF